MAKLPKIELSNFTGVMKAAAKADGNIDISLIDIEKQVRTQFGDLKQFAEGIKASGLDNPIMVMEKPDGRYRLIAGERRVRAFRLLNWTEIPARIKRDLTELEIRGLQVRENNDRENLTAYDEAMGVAEDVAKFGFQGAVGIWNRSESWVSKRMAVEKYVPAVLELLQKGFCGDLEVLHSLNQLHSVSVTEYNAMAHRMRSGVTVSRDDVRNKVSTAKVWAKQQKATSAALAKSSTNDQDNDSADLDQSQALDGENEASEADSASHDAVAKPSSKKAAAKKAKKSKVDTKETKSVVSETPSKSALDDTIHNQRAEMMEWGSYLRTHVNRMQNNMANAGYDLSEGEWVLWTAFLDSVLPLLASLDKARASAYLKRLQIELKSQDPLTLWRDLHPAGPGEDNDSDDAGREPVANMPKGWTF